MKVCSKCKEELPLSEFHKDNQKKDGLHPWCKKCRNEQYLSWEQNNPKKATFILNKTCSRCKEEKIASEFYASRNKKDGLHPWCKPCTKERNRTWLQNNKEKAYIKNKQWRKENKDHCRNKAYVELYGITIEEYNQILSEQGGVCAICKEEGRPHLHVDHNHDTREIRGLLCRKCNSGLGFFNDNPNLTQKATEYLNRRKI